MGLNLHPDLDIIKIIIAVEGKDIYEIPVKGADSIEVAIPGGVTYTMTLEFKVLNNKLEKLTYKQNVKKMGVTVKAREVELGDFEPSEEVYAHTFPSDETPGGWMMRGRYNATSTYIANGQELIVNDWTLEIVAK